MINFLLKSLLVLTTAALLDVFIALYNNKSVEGKNLARSIYSILTGICGWISFSISLNELEYLPALLLGYGIGAYYAIDLENMAIKKWPNLKKYL